MWHRRRQGTRPAKCLAGWGFCPLQGTLRYENKSLGTRDVRGEDRGREEELGVRRVAVHRITDREPRLLRATPSQNPDRSGPPRPVLKPLEAAFNPRVLPVPNPEGSGQLCTTQTARPHPAARGTPPAAGKTSCSFSESTLLSSQGRQAAGRGASSHAATGTGGAARRPARPSFRGACTGRCFTATFAEMDSLASERLHVC